MRFTMSNSHKDKHSKQTEVYVDIHVNTMFTAVVKQYHCISINNGRVLELKSKWTIQLKYYSIANKLLIHNPHSSTLIFGHSPICVNNNGFLSTLTKH